MQTVHLRWQRHFVVVPNAVVRQRGVEAKRGTVHTVARELFEKLGRADVLIKAQCCSAAPYRITVRVALSLGPLGRDFDHFQRRRTRRRTSWNLGWAERKLSSAYTDAQDSDYA